MISCKPARTSVAAQLFLGVGERLRVNGGHQLGQAGWGDIIEPDHPRDLFHDIRLADHTRVDIQAVGRGLDGEGLPNKRDHEFQPLKQGDDPLGRDFHPQAAGDLCVRDGDRGIDLF